MGQQNARARQQAGTAGASNGNANTNDAPRWHADFSGQISHLESTIRRGGADIVRTADAVRAAAAGSAMLLRAAVTIRFLVVLISVFVFFDKWRVEPITKSGVMGGGGGSASVSTASSASPTSSTPLVSSNGGGSSGEEMIMAPATILRIALLFIEVLAIVGLYDGATVRHWAAAGAVLMQQQQQQQQRRRLESRSRPRGDGAFSSAQPSSPTPDILPFLPHPRPFFFTGVPPLASFHIISFFVLQPLLIILLPLPSALYGAWGCARLPLSVAWWFVLLPLRLLWAGAGFASWVVLLAFNQFGFQLNPVFYFEQLIRKAAVDLFPSNSTITATFVDSVEIFTSASANFFSWAPSSPVEVSVDAVESSDVGFGQSYGGSNSNDNNDSGRPVDFLVWLSLSVLYVFASAAILCAAYGLGGGRRRFGRERRTLRSGAGSDAFAAITAAHEAHSAAAEAVEAPENEATASPTAARRAPPVPVAHANFAAAVRRKCAAVRGSAPFPPHSFASNESGSDCGDDWLPSTFLRRINDEPVLPTLPSTSVGALRSGDGEGANINANDITDSTVHLGGGGRVVNGRRGLGPSFDAAVPPPPSPYGAVRDSRGAIVVDPPLGLPLAASLPSSPPHQRGLWAGLLLGRVRGDSDTAAAELLFGDGRTHPLAPGVSDEAALWRRHGANPPPPAPSVGTGNGGPTLPPQINCRSGSRARSTGSTTASSQAADYSGGGSRAASVAGVGVSGGGGVRFGTVITVGGVPLGTAGVRIEQLLGLSSTYTLVDYYCFMAWAAARGFSVVDVLNQLLSLEEAEEGVLGVTFALRLSRRLRAVVVDRCGLLLRRFGAWLGLAWWRELLLDCLEAFVHVLRGTERRPYNFSFSRPLSRNRPPAAAAAAAASPHQLTRLPALPSRSDVAVAYSFWASPARYGLECWLGISFSNAALLQLSPPSAATIGGGVEGLSHQDEEDEPLSPLLQKLGDAQPYRLDPASSSAAAASSSSAAASSNSSNACVLCLHNRADVLLIPCGHVSCCVGCVRSVVSDRLARARRRARKGRAGTSTASAIDVDATEAEAEEEDDVCPICQTAITDVFYPAIW